MSLNAGVIKGKLDKLFEHDPRAHVDQTFGGIGGIMCKVEKSIEHDPCSSDYQMILFFHLIRRKLEKLYHYDPCSKDDLRFVVIEKIKWNTNNVWLNGNSLSVSLLFCEVRLIKHPIKLSDQKGRGPIVARGDCGVLLWSNFLSVAGLVWFSLSLVSVQWIMRLIESFLHCHRSTCLMASWLIKCYWTQT